MSFIKLAIWVATAFFVGMLFSPLIGELLVRLQAGSTGGMP
jgi:hypothetical protein